MGFSPLAAMSLRIPDGGRSVPRNTAITGFGIHHNAGVNAYGEASNPNREVSANYWIANDGTVIPNIDETRRAFTSGSAGYPAGAQADFRNITVEVSNSPEGVRNGSWAISDAAMKSLVALIADVYTRYNLGPVVRGNGSYSNPGNGLGVHQDWVPTSCPGPYIMGNLGRIISEAEALRSGGSPTPQPIEQEEDDMSTLYARATANSSTSPNVNGGAARVWAGERTINGTRYSSVWAIEDGYARRLTAFEWEVVEKAYKATGRPIPLADVHGNTIEVIQYGPAPGTGVKGAHKHP